MLTKGITWLILIAFAVAAPVAYFVMNEWLSGFAYRTELSLWLFLAAGLAAFLIAGLTVSYQVIKAALADPVDSLRYE